MYIDTRKPESASLTQWHAICI